jgi:alpha-galactosidase
MFTNSVLKVDPNDGAGSGWTLSSVNGATSLSFGFPVVPIDGNDVPLVLTRFEPTQQPERLSNGVTSYRFGAHAERLPGLFLEIEYRVSDDSPILRFRYRITSETPHSLTKVDGTDRLSYFKLSYAPTTLVKEVQLSQFNSFVHSFCLAENVVDKRDFENSTSVMGPLLVGMSADSAFLVGYEHGSQVPDAFLQFDLTPDRNVTLRAVKGNYHHGQRIDADTPFETVWMQAGLIQGGEDELAEAYRGFVLSDMSTNAASRQPFVFYNTWAHQERVKAWQKRPYLADMNEARMLAEVEVAARMGIDVFVIDTGWYEKTGDWRVSSARFPNGLAPIKAKLDEYGMKLGLWFNPTVAAISSEMRKNHEDCLMTRNGKPHDPHEVWETEASQGLCLVSRYGEAFADELIRLNREVGVTYFKWDAIGQYGCDAAGHGHGTEENSSEERRQCYGFQLGAAMARVVDKVCAACPEAIVDFDITEGGRTVGLQFLAAGKYFLINNGPYNFDYNMPVPADGNVNLFFFPGPARGWVCRTPLTYDRWIPSVLFLTHYLPDDRYTVYGWNGNDREVTDPESQWVNLASLVLGQNGIWGDLLAVTDEGVARIGDFLRRYKQVRDDITAATLARTGQVGGSPEVYEKVHASGRGVVSLFASASGNYTYVTRAGALAQNHWHNDGVSVSFDSEGRARITARFEKSGAKVVLFGVDS